MSSSCVVDAFVSSAPTLPVSQYPNRSGMSSSVGRLRDARGVDRAATSWNSVLIGNSWMPVVAYSSSGETARNDLSTTPSVRASR